MEQFLLDELYWATDDPVPIDDIRARQRQGSHPRALFDQINFEFRYGNTSYRIYRYFPSLEFVAVAAISLGYGGYSHLRLSVLIVSWFMFVALTTTSRPLPPYLFIWLGWETRLLLFSQGILLGLLVWCIYSSQICRNYAAIIFSVVAFAASVIYLIESGIFSSSEHSPVRGFKYKRTLPHHDHLDGTCPPYALIRTLRLHRRLPFQTLRATVEYKSLGDEKKNYVAISYTWGEHPNKSKSLFLDGSVFPCTEATYNALYQVSSMWTSPLIWIDYVCIDQYNDTEKGGQLQLMRYIYSRAEEVRVQIMPPAGHTLTSGDINGVGVLIRRLAWFINDCYPSPQELVDLLHREIDMFGESRWSNLVDFFANPWFTRVWIIQEVIMGGLVEVYYKDRYINWESMSDVAGILTEPELLPLLRRCRNGMRARKNAMNLSGILRIRHYHKKYAMYADYMHSNPNTEAFFRVALRMRVMPLSFLLSACSHFDATVAKDKVYALLGMIIDIAATNRLWPSYTKSASEVMGDTARHLVENDLYFDVLSYAGVGLGERRTPDIPSWVPDWANPPLSTPLHVLRLKGMKSVRYYASTPSLLRYGRKPNNDIKSPDGLRDATDTHQLREIAWGPENSLLLRGSYFDEIIALGPVLAPYKANDSDLKNIYPQISMISFGAPSSAIALSPNDLPNLFTANTTAAGRTK